MSENGEIDIDARALTGGYAAWPYETAPRK